VDVQLFGFNPYWHHRMNLLFHVANTLLLFLVLLRMTKAFWQSAFVAALFALHPLHVQSVAWVAERKDVLSTLFWMLTMGAYCAYVERPGSRRYLLVLLLFALGLMAKPMLVTLPFVLLLLDYWPLGRFEPDIPAGKTATKQGTAMASGKGRGKAKENRYAAASPDRGESMGLLIWEKLPLIGLAALSSVVTWSVQLHGGTVSSTEALPLVVRVENAFVSYVVYVEKMIWPAGLAVYYPYPRLLPLWQVLGAALLIVAVTLVVLRAAKRYRYLATGWLWYVGTLVPVIGLVQVGAQARADRYTYIPLIGLFIVMAWGIPDLLGKWRYRKEALAVSSALALSGLFVVTWTQVGYWQSGLMLFGHALEVTDRNHVAYEQRAETYADLGDPRRAIADYDRAIEINPQFALAYNNRGNGHRVLGDQQRALRDYDKALGIDPTLAEAYFNRGNTYAMLGNREEALADYDRAVGVNPGFATAYRERATLYATIGDQGRAIADYGRAIRINPSDGEAYFDRGNAYGALGDYGQAIKDYDKALVIRPSWAEAYFNRGNAYAALGNNREAIADYGRAIRINPSALAYTNRGNVYAVLGDPKQAIADYDRAIAINPRLALAYHNRAASHDRLGDKKRAYGDLKQAALLGDKGAQDFLRSRAMGR